MLNIAAPTSSSALPIVRDAASTETRGDEAEQQRLVRHDEAIIIRNAALAGLLRGERLENLLELIVLSAEHEAEHVKCAILLANTQTGMLSVAAAPKLPEAATRILCNMPIADQHGLSGTAAFRRGEACLENFFTDPAGEAYREFGRLAGISSGWAVALLSPAGELLGTFSAYSEHPGRLPEHLLSSLRQASQVASLLILHYHQSAAVQSGEATFHGLFNALDDALFVLDPGGRILDANPAAERLTQQSHAELIGNTPSFLAAAADVSDVGAFQSSILAALAGRPQEIQFSSSNRPGCVQLMHLRFSGTAYFGQPAVIMSASDISERVSSEQKLRLAASVFANAHEGIMITDVNAHIVEVNPTFSELTGFSREEAIGRNADLLNSGHHDKKFYQAMWRSINKDGYWRGEVWNRKKSGEIFVELLTISAVRDVQQTITHYVAIFSDITLIKEHQQRLEHLAHFDALTQLPNRMLLADRMQLAMAHADRQRRLLAVCYLDLDGFKPVNDTYGHSAGDRLLIEVAQRLKACVRGDDTVARLGGDEFVLLLSGLVDVHECDQALKRISSGLSQPFHINGHDASISASIGVTLYPQDGSDADTLLRHADQAMYVAKQAGRNRHHLFDPENDRRARRRRDEVTRIHEGLIAGEFVLYHQPKVDMRQGRVVGAEALIRWQHPERGLLQPADFLPATEGNELAIELGDWVIGAALKQLSEWAAAGITLELSINIAGEHLQNPGFSQALARHLAAYPELPPERLAIEVLETAAIDDIALVADLFSECRKLGVSFALDDFGTGYSSLTYFRRLPAEMLKIDQSFVRDMLDDPEDLAIVEGVIGLTRAFKRKVIAEGVETVEHGLVLLLLGCDLAQGFGIARPMPAAAMPAWIAAFRPDELWGAASAFEWSREDLPMLIAEVDHRRWLKILEAYLNDETASAPMPELDEHACGFGRWYHGSDSKRYNLIPTFRMIDEIHCRLHEIARQMIELHQAGKSAESAMYWPTMREASLQMSSLLQQLQAEILIGNPASATL